MPSLRREVGRIRTEITNVIHILKDGVQYYLTEDEVRQRIAQKRLSLLDKASCASARDWWMPLSEVLTFLDNRRTARTNKPRAHEQDQAAVVREAVWQQAMRPAGIAAKWASICGTLSVFKVEHMPLLERIVFAVMFSTALAVLVTLPVYLIALLCYACIAAMESGSLCVRMKS